MASPICSKPNFPCGTTLRKILGNKSCAASFIQRFQREDYHGSRIASGTRVVACTLERVPFRWNRDVLKLIEWRMSLSENRVPLFRDMRWSRCGRERTSARSSGNEMANDREHDAGR